MKKITNDDFIKKSIKIHGDKYDYSLVKYNGQKNKVKIICPIHGVFEQLPDNHYKYNCLECSGKKKKTNDEFIKRSIRIHGNKYDYSLIDYINCSTKVKIICPIHGVFEQSSDVHIFYKCGCPKCSGKYITTEEVIEQSIKTHSNKYDYSLVEYKNSYTDIKIICPIHGEFSQNSYSHIKGSGCPKCITEQSRIKIDDFIVRSNIIHNNKYDYTLVNYVNTRTKVKIICPIHGEFSQTPNKHLQNRGCPHCRMSKGEIEIKKFLDTIKISYIYEYRFKDCKNINTLPFDFYLPTKNIVIEFDGQQHFESVYYWGGEYELKNIKLRDKIKNEYCKENNIKLVRIKYDEDITEILNKNI